MSEIRHLRVINIEKEYADFLAGEPSTFDMESAIKEQGFWECGEFHCNQCPYMRNIKCLDRFGLLAGDPKYDTNFRDVLHIDPGTGQQHEPQPKEILYSGSVEIWEKAPIRIKSKKQLKKERKEEERRNRGKR